MNDRHLPVPDTEQRMPVRGESRRYLRQATEDEDSQTGINSLLAMLDRWRWTILLGALPVWILAGVWTATIPEEYESTATFLVEKGDGSLGATPFAALEQLGNLTNTLTEVEVAKGRRVIEPVVEDLALHVVLETDTGKQRPEAVFPVFQAEREAAEGEYRIRASGAGPATTFDVVDVETGERLARAAPGEGASFAGLTFVLPERIPPGALLHVSLFEDAVTAVRERVSIQPARRDVDLVEIRCTAGEPRQAQRLCASILDSYLSVRSSLQRTEAKATAEFLGGQVDQVEDRLRAAEDSLRVYLSRNRAVAATERANEGVRQFVSLQAERDQLEAERTALARLIQEIEQEGDRPGKYRQLASFPTFITSQNHIVTELVQSLVDLENQRVGLALRRTEANPDLAAVDARIEEIEGQLHSIAVGYERALAAKIQSLGGALETTSQQLVDIPSQEVESARLRRQVTLLEELYGFLQTRLREAEIAQAVTLPSVRVVDEASLSRRPSGPSRSINLALGFGFGLGFGLLLALFREHTDNRIRERSELERNIGIPVLSMVPSLARPVRPEAKVNGRSGSKGWTLPARKVPDQLLEEMGREAFRTLSAELKFAADEVGFVEFRTLAITSPARGEGKTLTSCNLALARSRQDQRVLLIDGDVRAQGVGRSFGHANRAPGLVDVLEERVDWREALCTFRQGDHDLHLLPAGRTKLSATELIGGEVFESMLDTCRAEYDLVIIDTPPLNVLTDALKVCTLVEAVVVVVRGGFTDRDALRVTLDRLQRAKARVAGIVLNDVELPEYYTSYAYAVPDAD